MFFINKISLDTIPLTQDEKDLLLFHDSSQFLIKNDFVDKLLKLKKDYWITCNCNKNALLVICSLNHNIYIRSKKISDHHPDCFFARNQAKFSKDIIKSAKYNKIKKFRLYSNVTNITSSDQDLEHKQSKSYSLSKLGQILYTIIDDADINTIIPKQQKSIITQLTDITRAFQDPEKKIYRHILIGKFYRYVLTQNYLEKSKETLVKAEKWFPASVKPFLLFSSIATSVKSHSFTTKKAQPTYQVVNEISLPSPRINLVKSAPYFVLTAAILDSENNIILKDAFAMPIFSEKLLIPVESNYERTILKIILKVSSNYTDVYIHKPLFDTITDDNKRFRPDFVITIAAKHIFIEVLGTNDREYLRHKNDLASIFANHCDDYICVKAYSLQSEYNSFIEKLNSSIKRFSN